jgi:hypothetical protein
VLLWSAFGALYVPDCTSFSVHATDPRCRNPVLWIYAGYLLVVVGGLAVAYAALNRRRGS